jgi:hypothetical protein
MHDAARLQQRLDAFAEGHWQRSAIQEAGGSPQGWNLTIAGALRRIHPLSRGSREAKFGFTSDGSLLDSVVPACARGATSLVCYRSTSSQGGGKGDVAATTSTDNGTAHFLRWHVAGMSEAQWAQRRPTDLIRSLAPRNKQIWIHLVGDSTMRFFFAAWLAFVAGPAGRAKLLAHWLRLWPLHWLADRDKCSWTRAGWPNDRKSICFKRWRGSCYQAPCLLDWRDGEAAGGKGRPSWRLSFEWLQHRVRGGGTTNSSNEGGVGALATGLAASGASGAALALESMMSSAHDGSARGQQRAPHVVLFSAGVHESVKGFASSTRSEYIHALNGTLSLARRARAQLPKSSWLVLVGNGVCKQHQIRHWGQRENAFPPHELEANVALGNKILREEVEAMRRADGGRVLFLDRSSSMQTIEKVSDSPCWQHHPYGILAEVHVQMLINTFFHDDHDVDE